MKNKIFLAIFLVLTFSGCVKENGIRELPPNQDFVVVDPDKTPVLNLKEVKVQVWNQAKLAEQSVKPENKDSVFFVFTQEQFGLLLDNLTDVSDVFAKSIESNQYWQRAVDDYRSKKKTELEAAANAEAAKKKRKK